MVAAYVKTMDGLWQEIYETLNNYLEKTAVRRHHYIELKHLDDRNQLEREENEKKINHYQVSFYLPNQSNRRKSLLGTTILKLEFRS